MNNDISDYDKYGYDYEGYWQDPNVKREYEDQAERVTIKKLIKKIKARNWFCDLGAGFGRLFDTYGDHFFNIILVDYSIENLKKAQKKIQLSHTNDPNNPNNPNVFFVAANAYHLPLKPAVLDCLLSVRMMHHMEDPTVMVKEVSRVIKPKGKLILEYANKRHFFEVIKALLKKSKMSPFSLEPKKRGDDPFYNFHPRYIARELAASGFNIQKIISVSNLRHQFFKKFLGTKIMLFLDYVFQLIFSLVKFGPSIFLLAEKKQKTDSDILVTQKQDLTDLLICPKCLVSDFIILKTEIRCKKCEKIYPIVDDIYDFRVE